MYTCPCFPSLCVNPCDLPLMEKDDPASHLAKASICGRLSSKGQIHVLTEREIFSKSLQLWGTAAGRSTGLCMGWGGSLSWAEPELRGEDRDGKLDSHMLCNDRKSNGCFMCDWILSLMWGLCNVFGRRSCKWVQIIGLVYPNLNILFILLNNSMYSLSCCFKPLYDYFFCRAHKEKFSKMSALLFFAWNGNENGDLYCSERTVVHKLY